MRRLLESSWLQFGPAGRGSYDWATRSPSTKEKQGHKWNELELGEDGQSQVLVYVVVLVVSVLLLALLVLSSLTGNAERHTSTSSDGSDGVFVIVYLPLPYEDTLTKIRAASVSSSKDVEVEDLEAKLCPGLIRKYMDIIY